LEEKNRQKKQKATSSCKKTEKHENNHHNIEFECSITENINIHLALFKTNGAITTRIAAIIPMVINIDEEPFVSLPFDFTSMKVTKIRQTRTITEKFHIYVPLFDT
jgi:hypothetical protein